MILLPLSFDIFKDVSYNVVNVNIACFFLYGEGLLNNSTIHNNDMLNLAAVLTFHSIHFV